MSLHSDDMERRSLKMSVTTLLVLLSWTVGVVSSASTDYACPGNCYCATVDLVHLDQIQLVCDMGTIQPETPFYKLPGNNTVRFTATCDSYYISEFAPRALADLHGLQELILTGCAFLTLPVDLLPSASKLQNLTIYSPAVSLDIPKGFFSHTPVLEFLDIRYSSLTKIPNGELCHLKHLKVLKLTGNYFEHLLDIGINEPSCLPTLETLDISFNKLMAVGMRLRDIIPNTRTLLLNGNRLTQIDEHFQLQHLSVLDVSHNQLQYILPPNSKLEVVSLANNTITDVPPALMTSSIVHLDLAYNNVSNLTDHFCQNASSLKRLSIAHNQLSEVEPSVFYGCFGLDNLDLSGNFLKTLNPSQFHSQPKLTSLMLNENEIVELMPGTFAGLLSLQSLNLSHNYLEFINSTVWEDLVPMQTLLLSHNQFHTAPEGLHKLRNLVLLDLNNNKLREIHPEEYTRLDSLQYLTLRGNSISYVPRYAFAGAPRLILLNLAHNNISSMEYAAFHGLPHLTYLSLHYNKITDIFGVFNSLTKLEYLYLHGNNLTEIRAGLPETLTHLDLSNNRIQTIQNLSFENMPLLSEVALGSNRLHKISNASLSIGNTQFRPKFQLSNNPFSCECSTVFLKTINRADNVRIAYISDYDSLMCKVYNGSHYRVKDLREDEFLCEYQYECDASCSCCNSEFTCACRTYCPKGCTCVSDVSKDYNRVDCSGYGPFFWTKNFPSTTKVLLLNDRRIRNLVDNQFETIPELQKLVLRNLSVSYIGSQTFNGLADLQYLDLSRNSISKFFNGTFTTLPSLHYLSLEDNKLTFVPSGLFSSLTKLRDLNLRANKLRYIGLDDLLSGLNLRSVQLAGNPWECSCDRGLKFRNDLVEWLPTVADAKELICGTIDPELILSNMTDLSDIPVLSVQFENCLNISERIIFDRSLSTEQKVAFGISAVLFVTILVGVILVLYFRKFLQVWLFSKFGWRVLLQNNDKGPKRYDAFVSFSQKDLNFVLRELMPQLESPELPYRLCVHYRDWLVGECISINVAESVENSHRTILLLSDNFMQSEWCNYEFQTAHHQLLRERNRHLIVVLLQDEPPEDMDKDLQLYISTHTYLKRSDPWFWQKLKLAMPALSQEEITRRQNTPTHVQRLVEHQRQQMDRLNYRFQDGKVVKVSQDGTVIDN